jgi:hypothetical protein
VIYSHPVQEYGQFVFSPRHTSMTQKDLQGVERVLPRRPGAALLVDLEVEAVEFPLDLPPGKSRQIQHSMLTLFHAADRFADQSQLF